VQESFVCNKDVKSGYGVAFVVDKGKSAPSKVQNGAPDKNQAWDVDKGLHVAFSSASSTLLYVLHLLVMYFTNSTWEVVLSRSWSLPFISTKGLLCVCVCACVCVVLTPSPPHITISLICANVL
jgi:hypothetical protein